MNERTNGWPSLDQAGGEQKRTKQLVWKNANLQLLALIFCPGQPMTGEEAKLPAEVSDRGKKYVPSR